MQGNHLDTTIKAIFRRLFQVQPEALTDAIGWNDLEQWDSLGHLELLDALREAFRVEIPPEEALEMSTVGAIKRVVQKLSLEEQVFE
jgi:acyl carrier protein